MAQWFYEKDGKPTGPVSQLEIARLILSGRVNEDTLVWTPSFGEEWRSAQDAGLPRIVVRSLNNAPKQTEAEAPEQIASSFLEALEKKQAGLSSFWAILFFLLPVFHNMISGMFAGSSGGLLISGSDFLREQLLLAVIFLAFKFLCIQQDKKKMIAAGYQPLSYWWLLFPPGYFLLRWERTKKYFGLFLISMAVLFFAIAQWIQPTIQSQIEQLQKNMPASSVMKATSNSPEHSVSATPQNSEIKK